MQVKQRITGTGMPALKHPAAFDEPFAGLKELISISIILHPFLITINYPNAKVII